MGHEKAYDAKPICDQIKAREIDFASMSQEALYGRGNAITIELAVFKRVRLEAEEVATMAERVVFNFDIYCS
jgi:hypothetical protein